MTYAPIVFISAKNGARLESMFSAIVKSAEQAKKRVSTGMLNDVLADATARVQPPTDRGRRLKIYYMTQVSVTPPSFVLFVNDAELFHYSYLRYIENRLRDTFGFEGAPIKLIVREKNDKDPYGG